MKHSVNAYEHQNIFIVGIGFVSPDPPAFERMELIMSLLF